MPDATARLFVALWPGAALRVRLADWHDPAHWPPAARPMTAASLHLTLHFLGAQPRASLPALGDALQRPFAPFRLSLGRPAWWSGGVAVLEPDTVPAGLHELHAVLAAALRDFGLRVESRPFRPHLTLARHVPSGFRPAAGPALQWPVRSYALVESCPAPRAGYRVLRRYRCNAVPAADWIRA